ncbi:MAG: response regulator transcription factor [Bacteroidota bacterium]
MQKSDYITVGIIEDDVAYMKQVRTAVDATTAIRCTIGQPSIEDFFESLKPYQDLDILLLDIHLPGESGINGLLRIKKRLPNTAVIMHTVEENDTLLFKAFLRGAEGYLVKENDMDELIKNLHIIANGGGAISPIMARALIGYFHPNTPSAPKKLEGLGTKDTQILHMLSEGWTYKYIAKKLDITVDGVRYYIRKIYKRLGAHSRHEATKIYRRLSD